MSTNPLKKLIKDSESLDLSLFEWPKIEKPEGHVLVNDHKPLSSAVKRTCYLLSILKEDIQTLENQYNDLPKNISDDAEEKDTLQNLKNDIASSKHSYDIIKKTLTGQIRSEVGLWHVGNHIGIDANGNVFHDNTPHNGSERLLGF